MKSEQSVLRWGGLSGLLAAIVFIVGMPLYKSAEPFSSEGLIAFPDIRAALALSISLSMITAVLSVAFILVLHSALRGTGQALALLGGVLCTIGYIATALGDASTIVAFAPLSDLYHAQPATPEVQATVSLLWQTTRGIPYTFFFLGGLFMMVGFTVLGLAMFGSTSFGRRFGWLSITLGAVGVVGVLTSLFVPGAIGIQLMGSAAFANLIFLPLLGFKVFRLSRAKAES
jgi:hypothetical protein